MIDRDKALEWLLNDVPERSIDNVSLQEALNCVLAEDITSPMNMPPFTKSAMDGYAIRSIDTQNLPARLKIIEQIPAGKFPQRKLEPLTCAKIMTGAPLPENADAVAILEKVTCDNSFVTVQDIHHPCQNVCLAGEDIKKGEEVLRKGQILRPQDISVAATCGKNSLTVFKRPQVAVLATGNELVEPDHTPGPAQIRNSNAYQTMAQLQLIGLDSQYLGIARDHRNDLLSKVSAGLNNDILIISGGVSKGEYDLVIKVLNELGVEYVFHEVNIKPGRPFFYGKREQRRIFGLPGNPVSSFVTFEIFVKPFLLKTMGKDPLRQVEKAIMGWDMKKSSDRIQYIPIQLKSSDEKQIAEKVRFNGSGDLFAVSRANGMVIIPIDSMPKTGTVVDVIRI